MHNQIAVIVYLFENDDCATLCMSASGPVETVSQPWNPPGVGVSHCACGSARQWVWQPIFIAGLVKVSSKSLGTVRFSLTLCSNFNVTMNGHLQSAE